MGTTSLTTERMEFAASDRDVLERATLATRAATSAWRAD
jgi:hypothetical protein